eukprot:360592-Prorocentrum_minimum.AAC.1
MSGTPSPAAPARAGTRARAGSAARSSLPPPRVPPACAAQTQVAAEEGEKGKGGRVSHDPNHGAKKL